MKELKTGDIFNNKGVFYTLNEVKTNKHTYYILISQGGHIFTPCGTTYIENIFAGKQHEFIKIGENFELFEK